MSRCDRDSARVLDGSLGIVGVNDATSTSEGDVTAVLEWLLIGKRVVAKVEGDIFVVIWQDSCGASIGDNIDRAAICDSCVGCGKGIEGVAVNFEIIFVFFEPAMFFVANSLNMAVCAIWHRLDNLNVIDMAFAAFEDTVVVVNISTIDGESATLNFWIRNANIAASVYDIIDAERNGGVMDAMYATLDFTALDSA